nr:MAG TPA: hypothetical protein [Caudoviricetes sp.]
MVWILRLWDLMFILNHYCPCRWEMKIYKSL